MVKEINITGIYQGTDRYNIEEMNWKRIVERTRIMLERWKGRDLSLMGRLAIVKAQGIAQIQYMASNILMPERYIKEINRLLYKFIWKGPDKIKRVIARRKIREGGLGMPDASDIAKAASIQWIGRGELWADKYWNDFLQEDLEKLGGKSILNSKAHKDLNLKRKYSFNEYMFKNWWEQVRPPEIEEPELLLGVNIWTDERLAKPKKDDLARIFINKGLCRIVDFVDKKGKLIKTPMIEGKRAKDINILLWIRAINRIPNRWIKAIQEWIRTKEEGEEEMEKRTEEINIKTRMETITAKKMTQRIMRINIVDKLAREEPKYKDELAIRFGTTAMEWRKIDKRVITHSIASKNRSFMYRFNNGLTYNNKDFYRFGYKETDECSFCGESSQTSRHLFWECKETRKFWKEISKRLRKGTITEREVFLGENENENKQEEWAKNNIIALANQYIYKSNYKGEKPSWECFQGIVQYNKRLEERIAENENKILNHLVKWENIEMLLTKECYISGSSSKSEEKKKETSQGSTARNGKERRRKRGHETATEEERATKRRKE